ncbi:CDP-diacylglycerol--glycerol-3-phosphate 3-phosphatidyltransferase [Aphelenchoides fujianensis]|nr:CDP-diacylglycerol--glycerol-3-phosphate 3-phosphatidyltransferase [Aphelenchoides fujianensis]
MFWDHGLSGIPVESADVRFLRTPDEFYRTLISKTRSAKERIYLAALYLGVGQLERELIDELERALKSNDGLRVHMLFDYLRGTRGGTLGTVGMLAERKLPNSEIFLFHTPDLGGLLKRFLPERVNEIVGLQHMKFFIFDYCVILSGANLSDTYFTNRQDRYVVIENCPQLARFFAAIYECVAACSYRLLTDGTTEEHAVKSDDRRFRSEMNERINAVLANFAEEARKQKLQRAEAETMIFPFLQMKPFGIRQEEEVMERLLKQPPEDVDVTIATGYFNFDPKYADLVLRSPASSQSVLLAAPEANGFYGASGISGAIPSLYVYLSLLFHRQVREFRRSIDLFEFHRPGWSFHGKGIWIEPKDARAGWAATVVGSSNFGYRSTNRDLEAQVLICTTNEKLRREMAEERRGLMEFATKIEASTFERADRFVPVWVRVFARFFRTFF